jgi:voltage-gated potassium channel
VTNPLADIRKRWRRRWEPLRKELERRIWLDRWFPHIPLGLALAPLGFSWLDQSVREALGIGVLSVQVSHLEAQVNALDLGSSGEIGLGLLVLTMSIGVMLRSRLAWLASVAGLAANLVIRYSVEGRAADPYATIYVTTMLVLLIVNRRAFVIRSVVTSTIFASAALAIYFAYATFGILRLGEQFAPPVHDLETALYLVIVTASSVGFGDITPVSAEARNFVAGVIVLGIIVGATSVSALLVPLVGNSLRAIFGQKETSVERTRHYVIVGRSPLARNATVELEKRGQRVTLVISKPADHEFYSSRDVVVGDASDLSVLRKAGVAEARGVLALTTDDSENGFVVLGVNELAPAIPTVAALNDPSNRFRLKRAQPSLLLSLQVLGGELLAMALMGEEVDADFLGRVLQVSPGTAKEEGS